MLKSDNANGLAAIWLVVSDEGQEFRMIPWSSKVPSLPRMRFEMNQRALLSRLIAISAFMLHSGMPGHSLLKTAVRVYESELSLLSLP